MDANACVTATVSVCPTVCVCTSVCNFAAYMASGTVGAQFQWLPKQHQQKVLSTVARGGGECGPGVNWEGGEGSRNVKG